MARSSNTGRRLLVTAAAVAVAAGALTVASVPATAKAPSAVPAADAPGVALAKKKVAYLTKVPTKIGITVPLTKTPPKGLKVFYISNTTADAKRSADAFSAAAKALGWQPTWMTYPTNPTDAVGLVQQAIQQGASYIATNGIDVKVLQPAIDIARAANVPIFMNSSDAVAGGRANWIFASVNGTTEWVPRGANGADMTIANSNGKANTLIMNVPQYEIFQVWANSYAQEYKKLCPSCVINGTINSPIGDVISGKAGSAGVAYLRAHPEVNQVACVNANFCVDFFQKIAAAGITGVGLSTSSSGPATLSAIAAGTVQSAISSPLEYSGWVVADAMARMSVKNSLVPNWKSRLPLYINNKTNTTASTQVYAGPTNYTGQFKKLWKVG